MTKPTLIAILALAAAGCATTDAPTQVAVAEPNCKVAPVTQKGSVGRAGRVDPIEQRFAELQLANSSVRREAYAERGMLNNNVEQILRDCATN